GAAAPSVAFTLTDSQINPPTATLPEGATVTFTNVGIQTHVITGFGIPAIRVPPATTRSLTLWRTGCIPLSVDGGHYSTVARVGSASCAAPPPPPPVGGAPSDRPPSSADVQRLGYDIDVRASLRSVETFGSPAVKQALTLAWTGTWRGIQVELATAGDARI